MRRTFDRVVLPSHLAVVAAVALGTALLGLALSPEALFEPMVAKVGIIAQGGWWRALLAARAPVLGLPAGVVLLAGLAVWWRRGPFDARWERWAERLAPAVECSAPDAGLRLGAVVWWTILAALLIRLPTLPLGSFVFDDWDVLAANRTHGLRELLVLPHGDHAQPVYRLQVAAMDAVFGTWAPGWNFMLWAGYGITFWLVAAVARRLGGAPWAAAAAVAVFAISRTEGMLFLGYYIVSMAVQITAAALAAFLLYDRAGRSNRDGWAWAGALLLCGGALTDISGLWILGGVPLLLLASGNTRWTVAGVCQWLRLHRSWMLQWAAVAVLAVGVHGYIYLNKPQQFLSMSGFFHTPLTFAGAAKQIFLLLASGNVLQLFAPLAAFLPLPVHVAAFAAGVLFVATTLRWGEVRERAVVIALVALIGAFALEVAIARPQDNRVFFPQYTVTMNLLAVPLLALGASVLGRAAFRRGRRGTALFGAAALALVVVVGSGLPSAAGYGVGLAGNRRLNADVRDLGRRMNRLLAAGGVEIRALPALDALPFRARMPRVPERSGLAPYTLSHYRFFLPSPVREVKLVRNAAMDPRQAADVVVVPSLREACGPGLLPALAATPEALWLFNAPVELRAEPAGPTLGGDAVVTVPRKLVTAEEFTVRSGAFDPEMRAELVLDCPLPPNGPAERVALVCTGARGERIEMFLTLDRGQPGPLRIDLRQFAYFALQPQVSDLRLHFLAAGVHEIRSCYF